MINFEPITSAQGIEIVHKVKEERWTYGDANATTDACGRDIVVQTEGTEVLAMNKLHVLDQMLQRKITAHACAGPDSTKFTPVIKKF